MRGWKILRRRVGRRSEQSSSLVVVGSLHKTCCLPLLGNPDLPRLGTQGDEHSRARRAPRLQRRLFSPMTRKQPVLLFAVMGKQRLSAGSQKDGRPPAIGDTARPSSQASRYGALTNRQATEPGRVAPEASRSGGSTRDDLGVILQSSQATESIDANSHPAIVSAAQRTVRQ